jgi:DNA-binding MurR/RpiR family transcriptional regulator
MIEPLLDRATEPLTKSDRRIAEVLIAAGPQAAFLSAHELARRAETHPTTVIRFARRLGYPGYPDLQLELRGKAIANGSPAGRMRERLDRLEGNDTLTRLLEAEVAALLATADEVPPDRLTTLAARVIAARRIAVFGIGHSAVLAEYLSMRLQRSGYDVRALTSLDWHAVDALAGFGPGDEVIAIVLRSTSDRIDDLVRMATGNGIGLSLIGDLEAHMRRPEGAMILAATQPREGGVSILVPLTLCNALVVEVSRLDGGRSLAALEQRERMKRVFPA